MGDIDSENKFEYYPILSVQEKQKLSLEDVIKKYNLSDELIRELSTKELLEAVIRYPLGYRFFFYDNPEEALIDISRDFSGLEELLQRNDITETVYYDYITTYIPEKMHASYNIIEKDDYIEVKCDNVDKMKEDMAILVRDRIEEGILSQKDFLNKLSDDGISKVVSKMNEKILQKKKSEIFNYNGNSYLFNKIKSGLLNVDNVYAEGDGSKPSYIYDPETNSYYKNVYITTPKGSKVLCREYTNNMLNSAIIGGSLNFERPDITLISLGMSGNNCHAYTWANNTDVWMSNPNKYIDDKSYRLTSLKNGAIAKWSGHSAKVIDSTYLNPYKHYIVDPIIRSKEGAGPVVQAPMSEINAGYTQNSARYYEKNMVC